MEYRQLGSTDLEVSALALGTMTFGEQNPEKEAHEQLDIAVEAGINFIDTAEMYPVPPRAKTQGRTEDYIGSWLRQRGQRDRLVIATKVAAKADWLGYLRGGGCRLDRKNIGQALDESLKRLRADYIDLYQLHWPDRDTNFFGQLNYYHAPDKDGTPIAETLEVLGDLVKAGKIRHIGVSNETAWGVAEYLKQAAAGLGPRLVSIQNPYNLLNRSFEIGLAEFAHREQVGLLAYSPLGFGTLTGKYLNGQMPENSRLHLFGERYGRYSNDAGVTATAAYVELARKHQLDPGQMALAWVRSRPFMTSTIIGATSREQLETNIASNNIKLDKSLLREIEQIHVKHSNPCP